MLWYEVRARLQGVKSTEHERRTRIEFIDRSGCTRACLLMLTMCKAKMRTNSPGNRYLGLATKALSPERSLNYTQYNIANEPFDIGNSNSQFEVSTRIVGQNLHKTLL